MASVGWIAGTRDDAQKKLRAILPKLAEHYNIDPVTLPEDRDRDYEQAVQLAAIAEFLGKLLPPEPATVEEETQDAEPVASDEPAPVVKASKKK